MRGFLVIVLGILLLVGAVSWYFGGMGRSLPGVDRSNFVPSAVPKHLDALKSEDAAARRDAAHALWQIGAYAKKATPSLLTAAKDPNPQVRAEVARALGRTSQGTQDALPVLVQLIRDEDASVRAAAVAALAEFWRVEKMPPTAEGPDAPAPPRAGGSGRSSATSAKVGPESEASARKAVPVLTEALQDADPRVRTGAAKALGETGALAEPAVANLAQVVAKDPDDEARLRSAIALGNIGPGAKAAVPVLLERLRNDKVDGVRGNVAVALGEIRSDPEVVVPALVEAFLREEWGDIRGAIVRGLREFGAQVRVAVPALEAALKDPKGQENPKRLEDIRRVLGQIRHNVPAAGTTPPGEATAGPPTPAKR